MSYVLITGGAGFIGTNLAKRLAEEGHKVLVFDNLSRAGVEKNLFYLLNHHPGQVSFVQGDVRDMEQLQDAVEGATAIYHLAAQVAVTTSLEDPITDFEINARGTLNLLEAIRRRKLTDERSEKPFLLYTSTNKVLGGLEDVKLVERATRYEPAEENLGMLEGIGEDRSIEFCSPYGCSKGAADQYVLDYARNFNIPAVVFRMSCIYGPHQYGNEDQGWVAHFVRKAMARRTLSFYGDGKQVRDALFVEDLVEAFLMARQNSAKIRGHAFTIGGGPGNTTSLLELVSLLEKLQGVRLSIQYEKWRPSDQRYYVSNHGKFTRMTGWRPVTSLEQGIQSLEHWVRSLQNEKSRTQVVAEQESGEFIL